jgi:hypothetical protein
MKHLLIALISTIATLTGNAQVQFGLKAGANFSNFAGFGNDGYRTKAGFQGGELVIVPLANSFFLQPEVNYSIEGVNATVSGINYQLNQNYLNAPVLIKYKHKSGCFAESGPQIGFLMGANLSGGGHSFDVTGAYRHIELSWAFGLGYLVKSINTGIDARYNLGFTNIVPSNYGSGGSEHGSVIQVGIFYLFGRGK